MSEDRIAARAEDLLPEEEIVGIEDKRAMAEAILADSDEREARREDPATLEHRTSEEAAG